MKNKFLYLLYLLFSLLLPLFTILNIILEFYDLKTFLYIINLNSTGIDTLLFEYAYPFWKVLSIILFVLKIVIITVFPILSYVKKCKKLYIIQFAVIFIDVFFVMTLPNNYFIVISNMIYHGLLLFLLFQIIKRIE